MIDTDLLELDTLLTQQADLQRDQSTSDDLGSRTSRDWQPLATVPCFLWWGTGSVATRIGSVQQRPEQTVELDSGGMIVPAGTDVTPRDRITHVAGQDGSTLVNSPLEILAVAPFEGFTELTFRRLS